MKAELSDIEKSFVRVLESSLIDLFSTDEICLSNELFQTYFQILIHYLSGNKAELLHFLSKANQVNADTKNMDAKNFELKIALSIAELRYLILEKNVLQSTSVVDLKNTYEERLMSQARVLPPLWKGEWYFVWARIYDMRNENQEASRHYFKARDAYEMIGATKKAIKSYFNGIICLEREDDSSYLQYKYIKLINEARKVKEYSVAGMAFLALSQKLLDIGALRVAFDYVQRALAYLSQEKGSSNYFKALLHRSHLYYLLGISDKAKIDFQEAKLSTHSEVLAALSVLENKVSKSSFDKIHIPSLPYAWSSRFRYEKDDLQVLGVQEEHLIQILIKRPVSKETIIEKIWGKSTVLDSDHVDLRFKKLMWRSKKKFPDMIMYDGGLYSLRFIVKKSA